MESSSVRSAPSSTILNGIFHDLHDWHPEEDGSTGSILQQPDPACIMTIP
jgi:hypothetical protein